MRSYLTSLILGAAVGVVYALLKVGSPAPPVIALLGLLGLLVGQQAVLLARSHISKSSVQLSAASLDRGEAAVSHEVRSAKSERRF
jgi:XapX domain-containing protein